MAPGSPPGDAAVRAAEVARTGYGRLVALLAAADHDVAAAQDALGDALEQALRRWPEDGVPDRPEAWLLAVARNRRRDRWRSAAHRTSVELDPERHAPSVLDDLDPDALPDRRLSLLAMCAHPAINPAVRTPLMLDVVLGHTAEEVARALGLSRASTASRLVRAKRRIRDAGIPVELPGRDALPGRMTAIREAVYGAYAIDWTTTDPEPHQASVGEALHLAEVLCAVAPDDGESHSLAALIHLSAGRLPAQRGTVFVPLAEQDSTLWDERLLTRGEAHLRRAHALGPVGRFQLEAAIQAVHVARRRTGRTDWAALRRLYDGLVRVAPSRGAAVARAAVIGEVDGPAAGLAALDKLRPAPTGFQPEWATRGHLLHRAGRNAEACHAWARAVELTTDPAQRAYLVGRRDDTASSGEPS